MTTLLRALAVSQMAIALLAAMVGSFADGGQWWDRLVLTVIHPVAAFLLLVLIWSSKRSRGLVVATMVLLAFNILSDVALALSIGLGEVRGDWWLPLVFSIVPIIAFPYCSSLLHRNER